MLNKKEYINRIIIIAFCALLIFSACSRSGVGETTEEDHNSSSHVNNEETVVVIDRASAVFARRKDETVQIKTDPSGIPKKVKVQVRLSDLQKDVPVRDKTSLDNIINTDGNEEYTVDGQDLYFENFGADISYEGIYSGDLPVSVRITYYLDGKKISPDDLAGKSGHLRIRFDYDTYPHVKKGDKDYRVLFTAITYVILDEQVFENVDTVNGQTMEFGGQKIALGFCIPGFTEIRDDIDSETLDMLDIPDHFEITADVKDFKLDYTSTIFTPGLLNDLKDEDLEDLFGQNEDMDEIRNKLGKVVSASKDIREAGKTLQKGFNVLGEELSEHESVIGTVKGIIDGLEEKKDDIKGDVKELADIVINLKRDVESLDTEEIKNNLEDLDEILREAEKISNNTEALEKYIKGVSAYMDQVNGLIRLIDTLDEDKTEQMIKNDLRKELDDTDLSEEEKNRILLAVELDGIYSDIRSKAKEIQKSASDISDIDLSIIRSSLDNIGNILKDMTADESKELQDLIHLIDGLKEKVEGLNIDGQKIDEIIENIFMQMDDGTGGLQDLEKMISGIKTLLTGFTQFRTGIDSYTAAVSKAKNELIDEMDENLDDMDEFKEIIKAYRDAGMTYDNLSGKDPSQECNVMFVIETASIDK